MVLLSELLSICIRNLQRKSLQIASFSIKGTNSIILVHSLKNLSLTLFTEDLEVLDGGFYMIPCFAHMEIKL